MINTLELINFMGAENEFYDFCYRRDGTGRLVPRRRVQITGDKGTGKTRIRNALIFAFTGRGPSEDMRPHHLISRGQKEAAVHIKGSNGFVLTRRIDHRNRAVMTECSSSGVPFTSNTKGYNRSVGYSPERFLSASIPRYFMELSPLRRRKVYEEHMMRTGFFQLKSFTIQPSFNFRVVDGAYTDYLEFDSYRRHVADMEICAMFQTSLDRVVNPHRFIFMDNADLTRWVDIDLPEDTQLFVSKRVAETPLRLVY